MELDQGTSCGVHIQTLCLMLLLFYLLVEKIFFFFANHEFEITNWNNASRMKK